MNYPKMDAAKVKQLKREGHRHLQFCVSLYRRQLTLGRHFLHEHPASAGSWKDPSVQTLCRVPMVKLTEVDQCAFGLTTPSAVDGSPIPAKKTTRFMTSSSHMVT